MGYPKYSGPLTKDALRDRCAVCGEEAPKSVGTNDGRQIGYCLKHLELNLTLAKEFKKGRR